MGIVYCKYCDFYKILLAGVKGFRILLSLPFFGKDKCNSVYFKPACHIWCTGANLVSKFSSRATYAQQLTGHEMFANEL